MSLYQDLNEGQKKVVKKSFVFGSGLAGLLLLVLVLGIASTTLAFGVREWKKLEKQDTFEIQVSGEETLFLKPDVATVSFTVKTDHAESTEAERQNTEKYNAITEFLASKSVSEKDIRTSAYTINPQYQYDPPCYYSCPPAKPPKLIGYQVTSSLQVKIRDLASIGAILKGAVEAGVTQMSGQTFGIEDETKVKEEAKALAIEKAKQNAKELADKLGVRLVRIVGFSESGMVPPYYFYKDVDLGQGAEALSGVPDIKPGGNEVRMVVTIAYEVK